MKKRELTRRDFLKGTIGAGIALSGAGFMPASVHPGHHKYNARGLPTAVLGKTGIRVPRINIGLGSRFCSIESENEALELLEYSLDNGLFYWDTAHSYTNNRINVVSEEHVGKIAKNRRDEIFISTKIGSRDPYEAMKQVELSLKRLQTDHVDMLKIHNVLNMDDVAKLSEKGNLIDIVNRLKEEKVARFIGFSGHTDADALKSLAERGDFDSMLVAMNPYGSTNNPQPRQELAIPAALDKGMGVVLMKVVRPREMNPKFTGSDLVRFALSLDGPASLTLGIESKEIVDANLELLRNFKPMSQTEKKEFATLLHPWFNHRDLEWLRPGYEDGNWS
jgi:uncharacterized protein